MFFRQVPKLINEVIFIEIMSLGTGQVAVHVGLSLTFCLRLIMCISNYDIFVKYVRFFASVLNCVVKTLAVFIIGTRMALT